MPWYPRNTRWEERMDKVVQHAATGDWVETITLIDALRAWQHRQTRDGGENDSWHDAELLWLRGVVLERAGQYGRATDTWNRLAQLLQKERESGFWWLPKCPRCADRQLAFAANWFTVCSRLRYEPHTIGEIAASLAVAALPQRGDPTE